MLITCKILDNVQFKIFWITSLVDRSNCIKFILIGYFKVSVINQILFETLWCEFSNLIDLCFLFHHFSNKILIFQHKFTHGIRWLICWLCTLLGLKVSKQ